MHSYVLTRIATYTSTQIKAARGPLFVTIFVVSAFFKSVHKVRSQLGYSTDQWRLLEGVMDAFYEINRGYEVTLHKTLASRPFVQQTEKNVIFRHCVRSIADVIGHSNIVLHLRYVRSLLAHLRLILFFWYALVNAKLSQPARSHQKKTILLFRYRTEIKVSTNIYLSKY